MDELTRELTGLFVGCDGHPCRATCSFHRRPQSLAAGDRIQLEVEYVMDEWSPLFHRCADHRVDAFPERHSMQGPRQALVEAELAPTGAYLPETHTYHPDALTLSAVELVDVCEPDEGLRSPVRE
jgi:hypothetical protein